MENQTESSNQPATAVEQFKGEWNKFVRMGIYERFEYIIIQLLTFAMAIVIVMTMWDLGTTLVRDMLNPNDMNFADTMVFQKFFGVVMTVIIALEFKRSILISAERHSGFVQARAVVMIGMLAIVRKIILLDPANVEPEKLFSLGAATLALGIVYWLVRDQDRREAPANQ